jgi:TetR/AcrR family transcriptional repressor of nem operon
MRLTKDQAEANRRRILSEAGRLFRERGFEAISVAELMQDAGFTHGGFYNHFASKSDLIAEVTRDVLAKSTRNLARRMENGEARQAFAAYIDHYLSLETRDNPGQSCPIATLGQDVIRQDGDVKSAFAQGLRAYLEVFAGALPKPNDNSGSRRAQAIASLAALIGGLVMARAVAGEDEAFSQEILGCVGAAVKTPSRSGDKSDI